MVQLTQLPSAVPTERLHLHREPQSRGRDMRVSERLKSDSGRKPSFALALVLLNRFQGDVEPEVSSESFSRQGPPARSVLPRL